MFEYKILPVSKHMSTCNKDLGETLTTAISEAINKMSENSWEYYRADTFSIEETQGCLATLFREKQKIETYNLLIFRREKQKENGYYKEINDNQQ